MSALITLTVLEPQQDGPPVLRTLQALDLPRVPCAYEGLEFDGVLYRIVSVRHVVDGDVAAVVQLEVVSTSTAVSEALP